MGLRARVLFCFFYLPPGSETGGSRPAGRGKHAASRSVPGRRRWVRKAPKVRLVLGRSVSLASSTNIPFHLPARPSLSNVCLTGPFHLPHRLSPLPFLPLLLSLGELRLQLGVGCSGATGGAAGILSGCVGDDGVSEKDRGQLVTVRPKKGRDAERKQGTERRSGAGKPQ